MSTEFGFSDIECKIIKAQIERRAQYRKEFLKRRTDPCMHSKEAGHVFDPAMQRFLSMKATQLEFFTANTTTIKHAIFMLVIPMTSYGYLLWSTRQKKEKAIRCGELRYKDRTFKFQ